MLQHPPRRIPAHGFSRPVFHLERITTMPKSDVPLIPLPGVRRQTRQQPLRFLHQRHRYRPYRRDVQRQHAHTLSCPSSTRLNPQRAACHHAAPAGSARPPPRAKSPCCSTAPPSFPSAPPRCPPPNPPACSSTDPPPFGSAS